MVWFCWGHIVGAGSDILGGPGMIEMVITGVPILCISRASVRQFCQILVDGQCCVCSSVAIWDSHLRRGLSAAREHCHANIMLLLLVNQV